MTKIKLPIALHEPFFGPHDEDLLLQVLRSNWVSTGGPFVDRFESEFAEYVGSKYAISVCNGTIALQLALEILKREKKIERTFHVIVPTLSFVATANAVFHAGGIPILLDTAPSKLNIDPHSIKSLLEDYEYNAHRGLWFSIKDQTPLLAILPAHIMGWTCDMKSLVDIAAECHLVIIEDAAEAVGSYYFDKTHVGHSGIMSCFSFNGNKILSTGGGGMMVTNDAYFAKRAKHLSTTAKVDSLRFVHDEVGYNYRLVNVLSALGCSQLATLNERMQRKKEIFNLYKSGLKNTSVVVYEDVFNKPNHWIVNAVFPSKEQRELALNTLIDHQVQCRPLWTPFHRMEFIADPFRQVLLSEHKFPNADVMWETTLSLPSSANLSNEQVEYVLDLIKKCAS
jgi:perosamine synthetase